jgi:hypothetical protein
MKANVGTVDRVLRVLLGLGIIAYGVIEHSWLGAIGAVPLLTGIFRFCPLYCPLRLTTCGR